ncbi:MAG: DNA mismatch repair protein MutS [bacterium]|nr:DNA mismatch repair protein MutS [bacterium]
MGRRKSSKKNKRGSLKQPPTIKAVPATKTPSLPQEDADLWAQVTTSLTPLRGDRDRLHFGPLLDEKPAVTMGQAARWQAVPPHKAPPGKNGLPERVSARGTLNARPLPQQPIQPPQQDSFSRREMRQINKGHQPIEARLDLHGLRQAEAHIALVTFLANAQAQGYRHILVITGKGRANVDDEKIFGGPEQGVLRRIVPLWLGESDLRLIVAGFSDAPRRHGGPGALYVRLRRKR